VVAGANTDGIIDITASGTNGHAPTINLDVAALIAEATMAAALATAGPTFSATNTDGRIAITTGGTKGHAPALNINIAALITDLLADANFIAGINEIITARFSWDGTKLCFDFNNNGSIEYNFVYPYTIPEKNCVGASAIGSSNNNSVSAFFNIVLVKTNP
jgi:hypothetical protein